MGTSIAHHLTVGGVRDLVPLGARSPEAFGRFREETGYDIGPHRVGGMLVPAEGLPATGLYEVTPFARAGRPPPAR